MKMFLVFALAGAQMGSGLDDAEANLFAAGEGNGLDLGVLDEGLAHDGPGAWQVLNGAGRYAGIAQHLDESGGDER